MKRSASHRATNQSALLRRLRIAGILYYVNVAVLLIGVVLFVIALVKGNETLLWLACSTPFIALIPYGVAEWLRRGAR